ncbi:MAG: translation initiation factor IF-2 [Candidatus Peribacteraceae bacterium]|nr:translation initiation factor IF-2 [Candidatus Peribacteraceae bacterium]
MRLVQVAKALGMTGQQLRKELLQVNFGVKPTDREIPDALAKGIVRFLANKHHLNINVDTFNFQDLQEGEEGGEEEREEGGEEERKEPAAAVAAPGIPAPDARERAHNEALNVLRKLTLDDVPRDAIKRQEQMQQKSLTKEEREERQREQKAQLLAKQKAAGAATVRQEQIKKKEGVVLLPDSITVKELAEKLGVQVPKVIQALMKNGVLATITQSVDYDTAAVAGAELGVDVQREQRSAKAEDLLSRNLEELLRDDPENLRPRPPIVVVMGHVDHGKTALLDAIRKTNVVAQEAGGITQHIGAYQVEHVASGSAEPRKITFLDTPGHEAFTAMRARGAQVTDIVILVVSAEEGVKATTIEAINHAKESGVPIIVAITKIDKERSDPDRVKGEVAAQGLQPEEWGGDVPVILCSSVTKEGIPSILDHILLLADLHEFKANPARSAVATVIESHLDSSLGPLATVIVNAGTLRIGDIAVCGETSGRVKALIDAAGKRLAEVPPSAPVRVSGLDNVPAVGDILQVVPSDREARALLSAVQEAAGRNRKRSFADLVSRLSEGKATQLKVVLKTDAQGSLEAIQEALRKLASSDGATVKVIHGAIGAVSESDVMMAAASEGIVLAFHAGVSPDVLRTAEREGVKVREHAILYELLDEVSGLLQGLIEPVEEERIIGHLEVKGVFLHKKSEHIIGGRVTDGFLKRVPFRLVRDGKVATTGRILSLKHVDKDIKEAKEGSECGMRVELSIEPLVGDVLEGYTREFRKKDGTSQE